MYKPLVYILPGNVCISHSVWSLLMAILMEIKQTCRDEHDCYANLCSQQCQFTFSWYMNLLLAQERDNSFWIPFVDLWKQLPSPVWHESYIPRYAVILDMGNRWTNTFQKQQGKVLKKTLKPLHCAKKLDIVSQTLLSVRHWGCLATKSVLFCWASFL